MAKGRRPGLRIATAERQQTSFEMMCLDDLLASDHRAREVWAYVEACDLSSLYEKIRAVEGDAGRPPIDPGILMGSGKFTIFASDNDYEDVQNSVEYLKKKL